LRPQLSGEEHQRLSNRQTHNTEAYRDYLVGRHHWNKRNKEGLEKAVQHFETARAKDPAYALSYAGLADCYAMLADYGYLPPGEGFPKAKAMAEKALELDSSLAEARTSLAFVRMQYDWDWAQAEDDFKRAILLNPNYATAHQWYSEFLTAMGRHEEALAEIRRAQELDPLSLIISTVHGRALYFARRTDDAIAQCQKTLALDRDFAVAHMILARVYVQKGDYDTALSEFESARRLFKSDSILVEIADAHARAGRRDEAQRMLQEFSDRQSRGFFVDSPRLAMIHAALGEPDQAFALLEQALEERSSALVYLKVEPRLDNLRADPRYAQLLRRIGLIK
jgi:tetratricopeptide (TPR) repeat protein